MSLNIDKVGKLLNLTFPCGGYSKYTIKDYSADPVLKKVPVELTIRISRDNGNYLIHIDKEKGKIKWINRDNEGYDTELDYNDKIEYKTELHISKAIVRSIVEYKLNRTLDISKKNIESIVQEYEKRVEEIEEKL